MRLLAAFAAHELRTQGRSLRFRVIAAIYAAAGSGPAALMWLRRDQGTAVIGGATYAAETLEILPALTAVLAFLIALDAVTREQDDGAWSTVGLAGMSNAGYLLRRWLALQILLIPLAAIPLAVAAGAAVAANGPGVVSPGPFLWPWLMHIVPVALTFSALAIGVGTIAGGALNAFLLGAFVLLAVPALVNALLGALGLRLGGPLGWLDLPRLARSISRVTFLSRPESGWGHSFPFPVSETPFDAGVALRQTLAQGAVPVALAAAALGLAVLFLRRTRPDVRPWHVRPDHPLRTFLKTVARLRERYTPDPAPARADFLALGIALLVTAGGSAFIVGHARRFEGLGRARFAAEAAEGPAPTPAGLLPGAWRVEGTLGPDRRVDLRVTAEMRNAGATPQGHLAFELNPRLRIAGASSGEGTLTLARSWDRLTVELHPPIPPGGRRQLRLHLDGEPAEAMIDPVIFDFPSFHKRFSDHLHARFARELIDFTGSYEAPAISPRRIRLLASDLSPIPRYQPWKLDEELHVEAESYTPQADVTVALAGLPGVLLADTCGDVTRSGRLAGACRLPLTELAVLGGRYQTLSPPESGTAVAVYPVHARLGELHLAFLNGSESKLEEAWPGLADLRRLVVLEWSGNQVLDADPVGVGLSTYWRDPSELPVSVLGNLALISEGDLARTDTLLRPAGFLAEMVASRLARRRPFAREDSRLFLHLFREIALQRLGLGSESGAAIEGLRPGEGGIVSVPPPTEGYGVLYWAKRFPALMAGLRHRMGEEALRQAIEDLLSSGGGQRPCTRQDLYAALARHGGPDLPRFLQDNFVDGKLAEPVLEGVEFHQAPDGWRVTGRMHNRGEAQAFCKVVLTTDLGPVAAMVQADGGKDGAFELRTPRRPQAVLLDPDKECHRLVPSAAAPGDRVFFQGGK